MQVNRYVMLDHGLEEKEVVSILRRARRLMSPLDERMMVVPSGSMRSVEHFNGYKLLEKMEELKHQSRKDYVKHIEDDMKNLQDVLHLRLLLIEGVIDDNIPSK